MGFIFRRIGGRLVPIKIGSSKADAELLKLTRRVTATARIDGENKRVGTMFLSVPKFGTRATVQNVDVIGEAQKQGIATELFDHAKKLLGRAGKKVMRGEILHEAQVKIRDKAGKSAFIGLGLGKYQETAAKLTADQAADALKNMRNIKGRKSINQPSTIIASTIIPKKFWRKRK